MNTLTQIFDWLLAASARASLLTVVVLIAQALLRHRIPARWLYALWLPVLLVLLVPVFPESPWSVASIVQASPARAPLHASTVIESNATLPLLAASSTTKRHQPINGSQVMLLTWCIGAAGLLLLGAGSLVGSLWQIKRTRLPMSKAWLDELARLAREIGLRRPPLVLVASSIRGPAVTGFLRPTLLLPAHFEETLTPQEARLVLKHELTHIKRGDLPLNALLCVLLALHWFNPLLWIAFYRARLDREAACDAQVLDHENQAQRVAYGHTLLKVETSFSHYRMSLGFVGIFQRGTALRSRIQSIATSPKEHPFVKTLLGLGIVLLTFLGITKAAVPDAAAPQVVIDAKFIELSDNSASPSVSAELPDLLKAGARSPGIRGVLDDPQFQQIIRQLSQRKGTDLLSSPRVTTRSGQVAKIEVGREMAYMNEDGKPATKTVGVTLTALPRAKGNDQFDVELTPQVVEFEQFLKSKSGKERPIFRERKVTVDVVMKSGQTSVLEIAPAQDKQVVEEADAQGRTISSRTDTITRRTLVFVTTRSIAPSKGNATKPNTPTRLRSER